jgi:hypothetical protein
MVPHSVKIVAHLRNLNDHSKNRIRNYSKGIFNYRTDTGEKYIQGWKVYYPRVGCAYRFVCNIFPTALTALANDEFDDWQNANKIQNYQNSRGMQNSSAYLTRQCGLIFNRIWRNRYKRRKSTGSMYFYVLLLL